jgi:hypothetical protein
LATTGDRNLAVDRDDCRSRLDRGCSLEKSGALQSEGEGGACPYGRPWACRR